MIELQDYPDTTATLEAEFCEGLAESRPGDVPAPDDFLPTTPVQDLCAPSRDELEERIEQRTAILRATNRELLQELARRTAAEQRAQAHLKQLAHVARVSTIGAMMSGLAHELGQPLTAISNFAAAARHGLSRLSGDNRDHVLESLTYVIEQAKRAGEIIRQFRNFVRRDDSQRSEVDVNDIISKTHVLLAFEARQHGVRINLDLQPALPTVIADRLQIEQVVVNLVKNAIEAAADSPDERRVVTVRTWYVDGEGMHVSVSDTGKGISPENMDRLFEPFHTTKRDGLGLGLSISRSIIQSHEGRIEAVRRQGRGATFRFILPTDSEEDEQR